MRQYTRFFVGILSHLWTCPWWKGGGSLFFILTAAVGAKKGPRTISPILQVPTNAIIRGGGGGGGGPAWPLGTGGWGDERSTQNLLLEQLEYNDFPPTVFSPTGRLHPVEKVVEEIRQPHPLCNVAIAIRCLDGILIFTTLPTSPHLNMTIMTTTTTTTTTNNDSFNATLLILDDTSLSSSSSNDSSSNSYYYLSSLLPPWVPIVDLSPGILAATGGNAADGQILRRVNLQGMAQNVLADDSEEEWNRGASVAVLARKLADYLQIPTQQMGTRAGPMLKSAALLVGNDQIWRIDPTGQFWSCDAAVVGRDSEKLEELLFLKWKNYTQSTNNITTTSDNDSNKEDHDDHEIKKREEDQAPNATTNTSNETSTISTSFCIWTCEQAQALICECLQDLLFPSARVRRPSKREATTSVANNTTTTTNDSTTTSLPVVGIPWVSVALRKSNQADQKPVRRRRYGTFFPPRMVSESTE